MPLYQAVLLAIVQGLTEFFPVSSSAHLIVIPDFLHWDDGGLVFDVALHVGTLAAIVIYFFKDWIQVIANGLGFSYAGSRPDENSRLLLWYLVVGTIPGALAGWKWDKYAEHAWRSPFIIGAAAILVAIYMAIADRMSESKSGLDQLSWGEAIAIGIAQAFAIIPGVSRSGSTIATARLFRLDRETSARFSFLLSAPIIAGAAAKKFLDVHKQGGLPPEMRVPYAIGILVSLAVGLLVIAFFLQYVRRHSLNVFVWYRIVFGIIVIALAVFFRNSG
ncbi:MAG: undecaprenyl-diphosphate phosphatase [Acidobacteriaceae bacterium]|nr:undecaprenyl-diphosphate phosphatase [Acidobacteriaceae bacterium]MBV9296208.1 undecaprenyl-diphosphate phosphatase [Acidobacteriaceae bacterium]MBV9764306.1 undecaprenyl-diphosphate phosphatase [Acidobacteriaceae bacterium]